MSYTVHVRRAAERDVAEAKKWYEDQRLGLATEFYAEFSATLNRLADNPPIYRAVYRNVRRTMLHRFPFLVWYKCRIRMSLLSLARTAEPIPGNVLSGCGRCDAQ